MSHFQNDWVFYPNKDSYANDITFYPNKTIEELIAISDLYPNCIAFNTYGFFKHSITSEDKFIDISDKLNSPDGLFVKKFKGIKNLYNQQIINDIVLKVNSPNIDKKITFSITTCKRIDLFEKTMNSFIHYCKDVLLIDEYICVDDNSSEEDRHKMKSLYPFFKFIMKTPEQKGHIQSMNIIIDEVKTPYLIHMEDDWQFYIEGNYITEALNIINQTSIISIYNIPENQNINNKKIAQVLFNKNYTEIEEETVNGGYLCITNDGNFNYLIHEHYNEKTNPNDYLQSCLKNGRCCVYWPHYSLRPSLLKTEIFKSLGYYTDKFGFFEREYAERFIQNNYISCFFDKVVSRHIGKLTSEKNGTNAYTLNNIDQFSDRKKNNYKIYCINLERRKDRKDKIIELFKNINLQNYSFYKAVDGYSINISLEIVNLFKGNDFGNRKGFIGCALSHYNLWKQLINSNENYYVIFEDDISLCSNFNIVFDKILKELENNLNIYDFLFLGYTMFENNKKENYGKYYSETTNLQITNLDKNLYIGATFSYIITKSGANKILNFIEKNGIKHGIDYLIKICPNINCFETQPFIVTSEWAETNNSNVDSDIQKNYQVFNFNEFIEKENKNLFNDWIFYKGLDFINNDIKYEKGNIYELYNIASSIPICNAFNTLGFFKFDVNVLKLEETPWINKRTEHGIFIKKNINILSNNVKENNKYYRIKMLCNWINSEDLCNEWNNLTKGNYIWNNIRLTWENDNIDYYVIINQTNDYYDPKKSIVFQMEPWVYDNTKNWGIKTLGEWANPDENKFLQVRSHNNFINACAWQLNSTWNELNNFVTKDKLKANKISSICSPKYFDPGHIKRIDFLKFLETKNDSDVIVDIYSSYNFCNFKNYAGTCPKDNKNIGILPYKYYFMLENNDEYNYITEKLWEPILSECLCFYSGCPNVLDYIDEKAFVQLDMNDFEKSYQIIKNAINDNLWEKRLPYIQKEKQKILNNYSFCPTLERIVGYDIEYKKYFGEKYKNIKNVCFIHCPRNTDTLYYFVKCFNESKILEKIDFVFVINYENQLDINKFTNDKIKIINLSSDIKVQENNTLALLQTFSNFHSNANILYLHTKENYYDKSKQNILDWINMMLFFNVYKFEDCLEYLKNFDTVGCNLKKITKLQYFGNFWWAKTNYINKLFKIKNNVDAEFWILEGKNVKAKEIFNSNVNHLVEEYSEELYITV